VRYFTSIAEQSFKTGPNGERLLYHSGLWPRTYIIPDADTEQRILRKKIWTLRVSAGLVLGLILVLPFLFAWFPEIKRNPLYFDGFVVAIAVAIGAASGLFTHLVIASDLKGLSRSPEKQKLSWDAVRFRETADDRSYLSLVLLFIFSPIIVVGCVSLLASGQSIVVASLAILLFAFSTVFWLFIMAEMDQIHVKFR
jgi:uncharacterized membrane protein